MSDHTSDSISRETFAVDGRNELSGSRIHRG
ncbi:hypothetical protein JOJ87_003726 [Rhodococcus ruber]|nr:hypothetical protein [Rhodococcus ruber]